jgi:hypothetical protein
LRICPQGLNCRKNGARAKAIGRRGDGVCLCSL